MERGFPVLVRDRSMSPTLEPGDRLFVDPDAYRRRRPRAGDIVVLRDPEESLRLLIKRVSLVGPVVAWSGRGGFSRVRAGRGRPPEGALEQFRLGRRDLLVLSDRLRASRDSRRFGPVPIDALLGRAWYRYAPRRRSGPLAGPPRSADDPELPLR